MDARSLRHRDPTMGYNHTRSFIQRLFVLTCVCGASFAQPVMTVTSFPSDQPLPYLGNGLIGYRVKPNPLWSWKGVASGFTASDEGGWETQAYAPYPFAMDFKLNDSPSMVKRGAEVVVKKQSLDMANGELTTEIEFPMAGGTARAEILQFISRATPVASCQQVRLTVPEAGELLIVAGVACGPGNEVYATTPPHHEKVTHLMVGYQDTSKRSKCGVSVRLEIDADKVVQLFDEDGPKTSKQFATNVKTGQTVTIQTLAATVTSLYHPEPMLESCRLVNWAKALGFEKIRCALFYTLSSVHSAGRTSMAPFGLSQAKNYFGHVFWDTDTYTTPALLLLSPETARMTVDYRCRHLDAAQKRAAIYGYKGAMYPWESGTRGEEATPSTVDTGWLQQHVNMCVAISAWWHQLAAGDEVYARRCTWPIVRSVAEWVTSRVEKTDRGYEIRNIMSSHEGMEIHNSCYVNGIAAQALRIANQCAKMLGYPERPEWTKMAEGMFIPTGPAPEGSGVEGDIIWMHEDGWVEQGASVDMFMLGFPFDLPFERDLLRRTYDFYMTMPNKTLSMGVVFFIGDGAYLGDREGQRKLFDRVLREKWEPVWGMGLEYTGDKSTCFVTTMAGMLQTALMGMTGIRFEPDNWTKYDACLPAGWEKIECDRIWLGGKAYSLEAVTGKKAKLTPFQ